MMDFYEARQRFENEYSLFITEGERVAAIVSKIFVRDQITLTTEADQSIFLLAFDVWKDFEELVVLAQNGLSIGASRSLRTIYEKVVTALYLSNHPEKAADFASYDAVQQHRFLNELPEHMREELLGTERVKTIKQEYAAAKARFKRMDKWTDLSMKELAKQAGDSLERAYAPAYALPSCFVHASATGLKERVKNENGVNTLTNEGGSARSTFYHAHLLLLRLLRRLNSHFQFGLDSDITDAVDGWNRCWNREDAAANGS